jgi:hypothetical protein
MNNKTPTEIEWNTTNVSEDFNSEDFKAGLIYGRQEGRTQTLEKVNTFMKERTYSRDDGKIIRIIPFEWEELLSQLEDDYSQQTKTNAPENVIGSNVGKVMNSLNGDKARNKTADNIPKEKGLCKCGHFEKEHYNKQTPTGKIFMCVNFDNDKYCGCQKYENISKLEDDDYETIEVIKELLSKLEDDEVGK